MISPEEVLNFLWSKVRGQTSEGECEDDQRHGDGKYSIAEGIEAPEPRVAISAHIGPHMFLICGLRKSISDMGAVDKQRPDCRSLETS